MFGLHIAYSLQLLVLGAGLVLIYFGAKQTSLILKIGGYVLTILTVLNMLCTLYYGVRYWEDGYFRTPFGRGGMMGGSMMEGMKDCPMMKEMMGKGKMMMEPQKEATPGAAAPALPEDHEAHH